MSKVKDVSFIAGPVRATLPDGSRTLFENGKEYLLYLNLHFGDGYSVIIMDDEENLKPSAATYDLNELVLTKSPQETTVSTTNNTYDPNGVDKEPEVDPIREGIFNGTYNGHNFEPTADNIQHYLDLYESDKHIRDNYGAKNWGNVGLTMLGGAGAAAALATPATYPFLAKYVVAPALAGQAWDETLRAITGTTTTELISNYLQDKGWNKDVSDVVGSLSNPGYWINFGGGSFTAPIFNKIIGKKGFELLALPAISNPTIQAGVQSIITPTVVDKVRNKLVQITLPALKKLDSNLYRLLTIANPWLPLTRRKEGYSSLSPDDLPGFKFTRNQEELFDLNTNAVPLKGFNTTYLLANSNAINDKVLGDAIRLLKPKFNLLNFYNLDSRPEAINHLVTPLLAGASAADITLEQDRNPYIKGLEYYLLGRFGINRLVGLRIVPILESTRRYVNNFRSIRDTILGTIKRLGSKSSNRKITGYVRLDDSYYPLKSRNTGSKPGFNYDAATFDDLVKYIEKNKHYKLTADQNTIYDNLGKAVARRDSDGKIEIINEQSLRNSLSKTIDLFDYTTGKRWSGNILVGEDGTVYIPQEYTNILRNNVDYVKNKLFPGSGIKLYGSSAGVLDAGFPHATHDIDFYITLGSLNKLFNKGILSENHRISPGTYRYKLNEDLWGDKGYIDLNVIEQTPEGKAAGIRAEELYKLYFPNEYYAALRQHKAAIDNGKIAANTPLPISRTPLELLDAVDPSVKTIMDSFAIDITNPSKVKHALRSWQHLLYSDPAKVAVGLNLFARSLVGPNARLFPITIDLLGNRQLNLQALRKLGISLEESELLRIASNPLRMKNVLDAWYLMDNTAMRYILGTWPDTVGSSANNFIKSATTWNPFNNKGNSMGPGLNTTIGGDSNWHGSLKAYILPKPEYKSTNLLDLIDEVNNNFGRNPQASRILGEISSRPLDLLVQGLRDVYDRFGWNFLGNGPYGEGLYASGTRQFNINTDAIGFDRVGYKLNALVPRLSSSKFDIGELKKRRIGLVYGKLDILHFPILEPFLINNFDRQFVPFRNPLYDSRGRFANTVDYLAPNTENMALSTGIILSPFIPDINK